MNKLTDFIREIRARVSSPIFSSFVISWLILNWRIPIALLFYELKDVEKDGYRSYIEQITYEVNVYSGVVYPMLSALAYTFIYPVFKNIAHAANIWVDKWGSNWGLKIAGNGSISVQRFIALRESYNKQTRIVSEVLGSEADFKFKNDELKTLNLELQSEIDDLKIRYESLSSFSNLQTYDGAWHITFLSQEGYKTENAVIAQGRISMLDRAGRYVEVFEIKMVCYSSQSNEYIFLIEQAGTTFFQVFRIRDIEKKTFHSYGENATIRELRKL